MFAMGKVTVLTNLMNIQKCATDGVVLQICGNAMITEHVSLETRFVMVKVVGGLTGYLVKMNGLSVLMVQMRFNVQTGNAFQAIGNAKGTLKGGFV